MTTTKRASEAEIDAAVKAMMRRRTPGITFLSDIKKLDRAWMVATAVALLAILIY
jgi:hypothetical protein